MRTNQIMEVRMDYGWKRYAHMPKLPELSKAGSRNWYLDTCCLPFLYWSYPQSWFYYINDQGTTLVTKSLETWSHFKCFASTVTNFRKVAVQIAKHHLNTYICQYVALHQSIMTSVPFIQNHLKSAEVFSFANCPLRKFCTTIAMESHLSFHFGSLLYPPFFLLSLWLVSSKTFLFWVAILYQQLMPTVLTLMGCKSPHYIFNNLWHFLFGKNA